MSNYTDAEMAEGKVRLGIDRLAGGFPFHAAVLENLTLVCRPEVGTMGVTVSGDHVRLCFNPAFVLDVTGDELGGVLLHEVHHVLFGHVVADPADYPDEWARTVAEEVTVNEFVRLPLPGEPITLDRVPGLPPMESTDQRYRRLERIRRRGRIGSPTEPGSAGGGEAADRHAGGGAGNTNGVRLTTVPDAIPGSNTRSRGGKDPVGCRRRSDELGRTVDDHGVWAEARREPGRSKHAIREVIEQALFAVGRDGLPAGLHEAVEALGVGTKPGQDEERIDTHRRGRLDWRRLLRRHVGRALEIRPMFHRPPRRFPELAGILPARGRRSARAAIMAIIDTSGSITPDLLKLIAAELAGLARRYRVTVVECDATVHRVYRFAGRLKSVLGRGGTDLRPPLEPWFLGKHRPDLIVFFTDGLGPAPAVAPGRPVVWCLTPGGVAPAKWGRVIPMEVIR